MTAVRMTRLGRFTAVPAAWQGPLASLAACWLALLALFWRDTSALVDIWWNSSTFTHCLLIVPILGWLVWLRAGELARLSPHAWAPGLVWIAAGAIAWMFGEAAGVALLRQLGLIIILQGTVPTLLGPQVTRGLVFPLFYSLFLVPVGEELVPPMQTLTADMAMGLLRLTGIPAHIEGIFITTPAGLFAVAEACSGVKFLVAMASLSALTAHLCFKSWTRRLIFLAVALIVPVLANGFRAFSTMWIAEHWGLEFAAGADHVIYGWFFFGIVIAIVGALSWRWFDREPDDVPIDGAALAATSSGGSVATWLATLAALILVLAPMLWLARFGATPFVYAPINYLQIAPDADFPNVMWYEVADADDWRPRFDGAGVSDCSTLVDLRRRSDRVTVCIARYSWQAEGREIVGYGQGAVDPDSNWRWSETLAPIGAMRVDHIAAAGHRVVATLYAVGEASTSSATRVKLLTLRARLLRGDEHAAALLVSARREDGGRATIERLLRDAGGGEALLARLTRRR
jgi:exosortase A